MTDGLQAINEVIRDLSRRHGAVCLELAGRSGNRDRENFADDGFHPSDAGHRRAAEALAEALSEHTDIELDPEEVAV